MDQSTSLVRGRLRLSSLFEIIQLTFLNLNKIVKMKLAIATLLIGSAAAFAPTASFGVRNSALNMATETTEKVCKSSHEIPVGIFPVSDLSKSLF